MSLRDALQQVEERIQAACQRAGRNREDVTLIAVGKTFPAEVIHEAYNVGQTVFGENRIQEAEDKIHRLNHLPLEWHMIGGLQSNKAKKAVELFHWIHSVDRPELVEKLEKAAAELHRIVPILIQVNLAKEPQKYGVTEEELEPLGEAIQFCPHLQSRGLMIIPPFDLDESGTRAQFAALHELGTYHQSWLSAGSGRVELSMGMTSDFEWAIEEGATMIRIGTAIFGSR